MAGLCNGPPIARLKKLLLEHKVAYILLEMANGPLIIHPSKDED